MYRLVLNENSALNYNLLLVPMANTPKTGPIAKNQYIKSVLVFWYNELNPCMLIMVIANPTQFTTVKAVPLFFSGVLWATKVVNNGESAMTTMPQKNRKSTNKSSLAMKNRSGVSTQQIPESTRE